MSEAPPIKTPGQLIAVIIAAFAIPVVVIWLLAYSVNQTTRTGAGTDELAEGAVAKRIAPLAHVTVRDANAPRVFKTGEQVYQAVCVTCHGTGLAGAPKFGDSAAWAPRIAQGYDALVHSALNGKGGMPARGGTSPDDYSDYEIQRAVVYMANNGGAKLSEPPAPAQGANAAASAQTPSGTPAPSADAGAQASAQQAAAAMAALNTPSAPGAAPTSPPPATASAGAAQVGKALYEQVCQACHAVGLLNAPKFGDKAAWAPRLKEPMETVYNYALHGKGAMPPKGGTNASDADVKAAVDYMVKAAK
jgi:cytochrome c5